MAEKLVLALDQGTTSSRAIVFDKKGNIISKAQNEFEQIYPKAGWVEHDPLNILYSQFNSITTILRSGKFSAKDIAGIGITNQRETTILWDRATGKPVYNAIVWQCRRTADECEKIKENLKRFYPYEYYFFVDLEVRNQVFKIFEGEEHTKEFYKSWNRRFRNERRILIKDLYGLEKKGIR